MSGKKSRKFLTPSPTISNRHWEAVKWRWEFMRRNEEYWAEYKGAARKYLPKGSRFRSRTYMEILWRWGFNSSTDLLDPDLSFDDVYTEVKEAYANVGQIAEYKEQNIRREVVQRLGYPLTNWPSYPFGNGKPQYLTFSVDTSLPDESIKEQIIEKVHEARRFRNDELRKSIKRIEWTRFPAYLEAYELKRQGLRHDEIAARIFSDQWQEAEDAEQTNKKKVDQDSLRTNISRYLAKAKRLINGGYKQIR